MTCFDNSIESGYFDIMSRLNFMLSRVEHERKFL